MAPESFNPNNILTKQPEVNPGTKVEQNTELERLQKLAEEIKAEIAKLEPENALKKMEKTGLKKFLDTAKKYGNAIILAGIAVGGAIVAIEAFVSGRASLDAPLNAEGLRLVLGAITAIISGMATYANLDKSEPQLGQNTFNS